MGRTYQTLVNMFRVAVFKIRKNYEYSNSLRLSVLSVKNDVELISFLNECYWGGVIEAFISCEEQWITTDDLWPCGWGQYMHRDAVVQIVEDFDPCKAIKNILINNGIKYTLTGDNLQTGEIILFKINKKFNNLKIDFDNGNILIRRFIDILFSVIDFNKNNEETILFVGGRGFSLSETLDEENQGLLLQNGFSFCNRRP